jgi:hypothetical protein
MKYLFLFIALLYTGLTAGQDLIITTTDDSLRCKIVDVQGDEIQFRFGVEGNMISIKKSEVASYKYNFEASSSPVKQSPPNRQPVRTTQVAEKKNPAVKKNAVKKEKDPQKFPPFYLSASLGYKPYGKLFMEDIEFDNSKPDLLSFGVDIAYFFGRSYGVGFKINGAERNASFLYKMITFHDQVIFWGPALYGRWGRKFAFTSSISVGQLYRKMSNIYIDEDMFAIAKIDIDEFYNKKTSKKTSIGGCLSIGLEYMISKNIGININVNGSAGVIKSEVYTDYYDEDEDEYLDEILSFKRNVLSIGVNAGIHFRF